MHVKASFSWFILPVAGALTLTGCPEPDINWTDSSCYCDSNGCYDYDGNTCTNYSASSSGWMGSSSGYGSSGTTSNSSSSGWSGSSGSSSGDIDGGPGTSSGSTTSSSSGGDPDGGGTSSGSTTSSSGSTSSSGGPAPNCNTSADCNANQTCSGGYCRFQCSSDAQCRLYDSRLQTCDEGICTAD